MSAPGGAPDPRGSFAERFALLYAEAGAPPLKRVAESVTRARRLDDQGRPIRVTAQRISDWRRGRNVPARFTPLAAVLAILIGEARRNRPQPVVTGLYDQTAWQSLWVTAANSPTTAEPPGRPPEIGACPYRGLAAFRPEDAGWFFGRTRRTAAFVRALTEPGSTGLVLLIGASGAGKSSLIAAGILPVLPPDWRAVTMTPGEDPLGELRAHVAEIDVAENDMTPDETTGASPGDDRLLLVVDQFEEVFTLCPAETRREFIRDLHTLATTGSAVVLLGLRADFYRQCLDHAELTEALQNRPLVLGPMTTTELREAVTGPAKAVGLQLEPGLVELMLSEVGAGGADGHPDAGVLPLLSHALLATWQHRQAGRLTLDGYRATRGIHGAVAATAEQAWSDLDDDARTAARALLLRMVRIGEDMRDTRRRATRHDLIDQAEDPEAARRALEKLAAARLVTLESTSVEIAHEAVLNAWPRLRNWIDQDRTGNLLRQRWEEDAVTWADHRHDPSLLYRGPRLDAIAQWQQRPSPANVTVVARDFLDASTRASRRHVWARRSAFLLVAVFALLAASVAVVAFRQRDDARFREVVAEADRVHDSDPSLSAQLNLVAHRLHPDDQGVLTHLLSTQQSPLATPLTGHAGYVYWTAFSPDGTLLATANYDHTVRLWNVHDRDRPVPYPTPLTGHTSWVASAVFTPDGHTLLTAGDDHTFRLWDVRDPAHPRPLGPPTDTGGGTVYTATIARDGRTVATADNDGTVRLWTIADPAHPRALAVLSGHAGAVRTVAFSPDGRTLASAGNDRTVRLWSATATTGSAPIATMPGAEGTVHSVTFSPDSRTLAAGGQDRAVRLWDVTDPATAHPLGPPLTGHTGDVWQLGFSPDGRILASGGDDTARLWNLSDRTAPTPLGAPLTGGDGPVLALAFAPDGRNLAVGTESGTTRLWSLPTTLLTGPPSAVTALSLNGDGRLLAAIDRGNDVHLWRLDDHTHPTPLGGPPPGSPGYVGASTLTPDGHVLAATTADNAVRLWDVTNPSTPRPSGPPIPLGTRYGSVTAFSPDGRLLATGNDDDSVRLWNVHDPAHPVPFGGPMPGHPTYPGSAAFSPDGRVLAVATGTGTLRFWDVTAPGGPVPLGPPLAGHTAPIRAVAFTPDGRTLATGSDDETIRLWDVHDPVHATALGGPLAGHTDVVNALAFSPDGRILASGSADRTLRLWDVHDPAHAALQGDPLSADTDATYVVAFDPRGRFVATAGGDGTVRIWDLDPADAVRRICATTAGVLTPEQWHRHLPQLSYEDPCR